MLRSKKQTYLINQSNFTSRNFQNRKLPILFSRVQNSPRGEAAQLATIQQARRAPTRFFLSVVAYCPPSPLPLTREKKKPKVPGSEGGVDYPRADSRVGNYSFRGEGGRVFEFKGGPPPFLICLFQGVGCWPVGSAPTPTVLLHKSSPRQEGGRASSSVADTGCTPIIVSHSPRFIAAQFYSRISSLVEDG